MSIPKSLDYKNIRPSGFPSKVKRVEFLPQNLYSDIKPNDIVRWNILAPGFWDPYNCNVRIKVDFSEMDSSGSLQLDGSAQSFINELIISTGTTEIERIQEYDVMASFINDMTYDVESRSRQKHQGLASEIFPSSNIQNELVESVQLLPDFYPQPITVGPSTLTEMKILGFSTKIHGYKPTLKPVAGSSLALDAQLEGDIGKILSVDGIGFSKPHWGKLINPADIGLTAAGGVRSTVDQMLTRADYGLYRARDTHQLEGGNSFRTFENQPASNHGDEYSYIGMRKPFNSNFSVGTFEDQFSKALSIDRMLRGNPVNTTKITPLYAEYTIPLLSGSIGALIPKDKYKLIPAFAFDPLQIEMRINPHAVFTSGYIENGVVGGSLKTDHEAFRDSSFGRMMNRTFKIIEMAIVVDIIQFDDNINNVVKSQLAGEGIVIHSNSYSLGPLYTIPSTTNALGTWQINMGFESLKSLIITYISNDYLTYTFCRKLYKMTKNITQLQTKIGLDYFPEKAFDAHAGQPDIAASGEKNNAIFLNEVLKSFGYLNSEKSSCILNKYNFAVNQRHYDVTATSSYLNTTVPWEQNTTTAFGWPMIQENRCVGRGFFVVDFTQASVDKAGNLAGVNTVQNRPFDLIVKSDGIGLNPLYDRPCTMMIFCNYDFVLQISSSGTRVLGRG